MPVITEPVDRARARSLRRAVLDYRSEPGRSGPTLVHVGTPAAAHVRVGVRRGDDLDAALRTEMVAALLVRHRDSPAADAEAAVPWVWLGRPGALGWQDADAEWLSAALAAYAEAGLDLTFVVICRAGWQDPRSGVGVEWKRLRDRSRAAGGLA